MVSNCIPFLWRWNVLQVTWKNNYFKYLKNKLFCLWAFPLLIIRNFCFEGYYLSTLKDAAVSKPQDIPLMFNFPNPTKLASFSKHAQFNNFFSTDPQSINSQFWLPFHNRFKTGSQIICRWNQIASPLLLQLYSMKCLLLWLRVYRISTTSFESY